MFRDELFQGRQLFPKRGDLGFGVSLFGPFVGHDFLGSRRNESFVRELFCTLARNPSRYSSSPASFLRSASMSIMPSIGTKYCVVFTRNPTAEGSFSRVVSICERLPIFCRTGAYSAG